MELSRGFTNKRKNTDEQLHSDIYIRKHVDGKKGKHTQEEEEGETIIKVGDTVNISDLLFTETRDHLIKYKDNQRVNNKQLDGKVIVLHFVSLVNGHNNWKRNTRHLLDVYDKLEPKGGFEVVFVAVRDDIPCVDIGGSTSPCSTPHGRFEERFSTMPWTAIPFSDLKSRKHLERIFLFGMFGNNGVDVRPISFVIDPRGVVVQSDAICLFSRYGAAGFPFTNQRVKCLDIQDDVAGRQLSMESLLASPERDYVITNKGEQVPIHKLKDKVVGLFFFANAWNKCITWKLKLAYEELSKNMDDFEVVLINLISVSSDISEDALWKRFEAMPWLAIPFKDTCCSRKLLRIFKRTICDPGPDPASKLVIIGPHGKFIEPFGAHILMCYGISAYPFTRFSAVKSIIENVKDVKPDMLWNVDAVFTKQNGSKVRFSQIAGKRIIALFQNGTLEHTLYKLKALYIQMKGTNDEFEVIHIQEGGEFNRVASGFPWLMFPRFDSTSDAWQFMIRFFHGHCYGLVAFDRDGTIVRMTSRPKIREMVFPFYEFDDMKDEVLPFVKVFFSEPLNTLTHLW